MIVLHACTHTNLATSRLSEKVSHGYTPICHTDSVFQSVRRHFECFKPLGYLACEVRHFSHATGCTDDRQKRNLLLRTAGEEVQDVFATLADTGATYDEAVSALNAHFQPQINNTFQRHVFRRECQKADETVSQFVVRLGKLSQHSEFGAQTDAFIRDQVVY